MASGLVHLSNLIKSIIIQHVNVPWFKKVVTHGTGGRNECVLIIFSVVIGIPWWQLKEPF